MVKVKTETTPAATEPTSEQQESLNAKCSICCQIFKTVQECLKHELLEHSLKKAYTKTAVNGRLKAAFKFLNSKDKKEERTKVHNALKKCQKGQELPTIFKVLCMDTENLRLIFTRIQTCLEKELMPLGPVRIYPFGSIVSGLALRDSDIDIFLDASQIQATDFGYRHRMPKELPDSKQASQQRGALNRINALLQRSPLFVDVIPIRSARVPIIKCKHSDTGFSIDINISCPSSMENTQFICELVQTDRRIHELLVFLKLWAKNLQIIGRSNMTSYSLITMIIFYLQQPYKKPGGGGVEGNNQNLEILKSVRQLQAQCRPRIVQGINYAFDLQSNEHKPRIPKGRTTFDLIKGFFQFYKDYDFDESIISPFYGRTIVKKEFTAEKFKEYSRQLVTITHYSEGVPAEPIQLDRCMCVQDSFGLNHNVARTMLPPNKKYFVMCLENAVTICENLKTADMIERLLYESFSKSCPASEKSGGIPLILNQMESPSGDVNANSESNKVLTHFIAPSKSDLNCIANFDSSLTNSESILQFWCQHYITAIQNILCDFYHIDMQAKSHTSQKQQRLDNDNLSQSWDITASVDLWSNRFFQKTVHQTFWEYHLAQTKRLHSLRRQNAKFAVKLNAVLTVDINSDYTSLNVYLSLPDDKPKQKIKKKDPLRKFFNIFKNTLQNYSSKDALSEDKSAAKEPQT